MHNYEFDVEFGDGATGIVKSVPLIAEYVFIDYDGDVEVEIQQIILNTSNPEFIDYACLHFYNNLVDFDQLQNVIYRTVL